MKISLRNIGKVKEADVEINGITVIAGENNTGKSTVGKALFAVFNSLYNLKQKIDSTKESLLYTTIRTVFNEENDEFIIERRTVISAILSDTKTYLDSSDLSNLRDLILNNIEPIGWHDDGEKYDIVLSDEMLGNIIEKSIELLSVSDEDIFKRVLHNQILVEFNGQVTNTNIKDSSSLRLAIKEKVIDIDIVENKIKNISSLHQLNTQVIYYDNPFILDELVTGSRMRLQPSNYKDHNQYTKDCLISEKINNIVEEVIQGSIVDKKIKNILTKINTVVPGDLQIITPRKIVYRINEDDTSLNISNLSTGLKAFVVIKTLLSKGYLEDNGTIILDEPEVHLHPEWQLVFAELIVLLQKEFNMHILINTHSPYFLRAIEIYSSKYEIYDKCNFYLAKNIDSISVIENVTSNLEVIYEKLSDPLQILEDMRWENE